MSRTSYWRRGRLGMSTVACGALVVALGCAAAQAAMVGGVITSSGRVGAVEIDRTTQAGMTAALGPPQVTVAQRPPAPSYPSSGVLAYQCHGPSISDCETAYFISDATGRFESFSTTSPAFRLSSGVHVGMSGARAAQLERAQDVVGCGQGIFVMTRALIVVIATAGGQFEHHGNGELVPVDDHVASISIDDRANGVGVTFC